MDIKKIALRSKNKIARTDTFNTILALIDKDQKQAANDMCLKLCHQLPNDLEALFLLGSIQTLIADYPTAITTYKRIIKTNPKYPQVNLNLGLAYINYKYVKEAEEYVKEAEKYLRLEVQCSGYLHSLAILMLGNLYIRYMDLFSPQDVQSFMPFLQKACECTKNKSRKKILDNFLHFFQCTNPLYQNRGSLNIMKNRIELLQFLPPHGVVAEIGVQQGIYAQEILTWNTPQTLHLIDCWEYQQDHIYGDKSQNRSQPYHNDLYQKVVAKFEQERHQKQVVIHKGYSHSVLEKFEDETFDWVYIDANHAYEFVKKDLAISLRKVKKGGYICGHDYTLDKIIPFYGVQKAVDEFVQKETVAFIALTHEMNASYLLQKL